MSEPDKVVDNLGVTGTLALVILMLTIIIVWLIKASNGPIKEAAYFSKKAEHAVNGVGEGDHRLYDRVDMIAQEVSSLLEFREEYRKSGWELLPTDIGNAISLTTTIRALQASTIDIKESLDKIEELLLKHVEWEQTEKYEKEEHL